jgi:hypothetical protein
VEITSAFLKWSTRFRRLLPSKPVSCYQDRDHSI